MNVSRFLLTLLMLTAPAGAAFGQMFGNGGGYGPSPYGVHPAAYQGMPCAADPNAIGPMDPAGDGAAAAVPGDPNAAGAAGDFGSGAPGTPQLAPVYSDPGDSFGGFLNRGAGNRNGMFARNDFSTQDNTQIFRFGEGRARAGNMYARTDGGYWHRGGAGRPVIAILPNGQLPPTTRMDTSDPDFQHELLPIVTLGYVLPGTVAIEGTVMYKDDFDAYSDLRSAASDLDVLVLGGRGVPAPPSNVTDYNNAEWIRQTASTGFHSYEIGLAETSRFFNFTAGIRYIELRDRINIASYKSVAGATEIGNATVGTYNWLLGSQMGVRTGFTYDLFTVSVFGKAGLFFNNGNSSLVVMNNNNTQNLASSNVYRTGGQNEAFVGELGANLSVRVAPGVSLRGGYNALVIQDVMLAADQLQTSTAATAQSGLLNDAKGTMFFYGPSAGVEFNW